MSAGRSLWLGAVLFAAPLPAAAQEMCTALDRIAAAARERTPFASLAATNDALVPGFRGSDCVVSPGVGVVCWRAIAPEALARGAMERTLRECLGREPILRPGRQPRTGREAGLVFVARGLRYALSTLCSPQCGTGMQASFVIAPERARRRR